PPNNSFPLMARQRGLSNASSTSSLADQVT
ncbi:hypothetical protein ACN42_g8710, partial [Penicillium freii]